MNRDWDPAGLTQEDAVGLDLDLAWDRDSGDFPCGGACGTLANSPPRQLSRLPVALCRRGKP